MGMLEQVFGVELWEGWMICEGEQVLEKKEVPLSNIKVIVALYKINQKVLNY